MHTSSPASRTICDDIRAFHERFGLTYAGRPRPLPESLRDFRMRFLVEELDEYVTAVEERDLEGQLDALVDIVYVALGNSYLHGFDFMEAWRRVHAANMTKVRANDPTASKRGSDQDVVKPVGFVPPNLKDLVT